MMRMLFLTDGWSTDGKIGAREIEHAFYLGKKDLFSVPQSHRSFNEPGMSALINALDYFSKRLPGSEPIGQDGGRIFDGVEMPLRAALKKHIGDLCADADEWNTALS